MRICTNPNLQLKVSSFLSLKVTKSFIIFVSSSDPVFYSIVVSLDLVKKILREFLKIIFYLCRLSL